MPSSFLHATRWPADCLCLVYFLADLLSEWESSRGLSWDEAWLYQTTITLHLHSICTLLFSSHREGACVPGCLCTLCYRVLLWVCVRVGERGRERQCRRRRRRKMREGKGEKGASIWYSHYTSCRFHLHLIVCLIAGKKQVIYQARRGSWSLFPRHGALCVCLCLYVSANACSTSIQTTVAFACVQWPNCGYELWQYLPKKNCILMAKWLYLVWVWT